MKRNEEVCVFDSYWVCRQDGFVLKLLADEANGCINTKWPICLVYVRMLTATDRLPVLHFSGANETTDAMTNKQKL